MSPADAASALDNRTVQRVIKILEAHNITDRVVALSATARSAQDAADSIGCALGAIVKSLVFDINGGAVMALVAGDRQCDTKRLPDCLNLTGKCQRADPDLVRRSTGMAIGGVAPIGHTTKIPIVIDESLGRFELIYAAAGHPYCVFQTTIPELVDLTGASILPGISK